METSLIAPPRIDFVLHTGGGWSKPIALEDSNGVAIDISGETYHLKTESGLDVAAIVDPSNALGLLVSLSEAQVGAIFDLDEHGTKYALVNTGASPDDVLCFGRLYVEGWS